jgi:flagellar biosynthesis chaperone FliJ
MNANAAKVLLRLMEIRKERLAIASKRAAQDHMRAANFSRQVDAYAEEYQQSWSVAVTRGDVVAQLQSQSAFGARLQSTAVEQQREAQARAQDSQRALENVVEAHERLKVMQEWLARQQSHAREQRTRREERDLEDRIQAGGARR